MPKIYKRIPASYIENKSAIGYVRVSTKQQAKRGYGLQVQVKFLKDYAQKHGLDLPDDRIFIDAGVSGATLLKDRPEGSKFAKLAKSGDIGHIIATDLDRLSRYAPDITEWRDTLKKRGIRIHLVHQGGEVPNNHHGDLLLTVLAEFSQMQRAECSDDTKKALATLRKQGRCTGGEPPYGMRRSKKDRKQLEEHPEEMKTVEMAKGMRLEGLSYREIGERLTEAGRLPRTKGKWAHETIRRMVSSDNQRLTPET